MSDKAVGQKLALKPGSRFLLVNSPDGYTSDIGALPAGVELVNAAAGPVEAIQVFVANRRELEAQLPGLSKSLKSKGMLWVTYHKGTSKVKTDINRDTIAAYARTIGMQPVALISIDTDWAALRLKQVGE